jgi:hypothetical protein
MNCADLKVGDDVMLSVGAFPAEHIRTTVTRTTATRVFVMWRGREMSFQRETGHEVGSQQGFYTSYVQPWDDSSQRRVDETASYQLRGWLRATDFSKIPLDKLRAAFALLKDGTP